MKFFLSLCYSTRKMFLKFVDPRMVPKPSHHRPPLNLNYNSSSSNSNLFFCNSNSSSRPTTEQDWNVARLEAPWWATTSHRQSRPTPIQTRSRPPCAAKTRRSSTCWPNRYLRQCPYLRLCQQNGIKSRRKNFPKIRWESSYLLTRQKGPR